MKAQIRKDADSAQISYDLTHQSSDASVYPIPATDGATIIVVGHNNGLSIFRAYSKNHNASGQEDEVDGIEEGVGSHDSKILKWLDVSLESPVQHIAFPPINPSILSSQSSTAPDFVRANVVVSVACANSSIHLVSFGRESSSEEDSNERDGFDIKTTKLDGAVSHQDMITSLAVTWSANNVSADERRQNQRSRNRGRNDATETSQIQDCFLVASTSTTGSGLLVVHGVPLARHIGLQGHSVAVVARQFMRMPLLRSTLSFNPDSCPSTKHTNLLVTSPARGVVKVLNVALLSLADKGKRDPESDVEDEEPSALPSARACLTLHAGYIMTSMSTRRKGVLDARWATNGKAIIALLEDGEWGIWNLENAEPRSKNDSQSLQNRHSNLMPGRFASGGNSGSTKAVNLKSSDQVAPVTSTDTKIDVRPLGRLHVCARQQPATSTDDAMLISFNGSHSFVASIQSLSRIENRGGTINTASTNGRVQALPSVRCGEEEPLAISLLHAPARKNNAFLEAFSTQQDLVIVTASRLILHTKLGPKSVVKSTTLSLPSGNATHNDSSFSSRIRNNHTLDVDAMDKMLEAMDYDQNQQLPFDGGLPSSPLPQPGRARVIDSSIASPMVANPPKSKLVINRDAATRGRILFE